MSSCSQNKGEESRPKSWCVILPNLCRRGKPQCNRRSERRCLSIHVRVGAQILEDFLAVLLVDHEIDGLAVVATFELALSLHEEGVEALPPRAAALAALAQRLLFAFAK